MANKYLEKIAVIDAISGFSAADDGDKLGGTVSGIALGTPAMLAGGRLAGAAGAIGGAVAGGYAGGHIYSRIKDHFRSPAELKKHLAQRAKR